MTSSSSSSSSPLRSKLVSHVRSISLPSRSHPLIPQFDQATTSSPSINKRLNGLQDLYDCVDDLLLMPYTQRSLSQESNKKWVNEVMDGYLRLLDLCTISKDLFLNTKQDLQEQLSILRRKRDSDDFDGYLASRKMAIKTARKFLKELKNFKGKNITFAFDEDHETMATIGMLNEAEAVTLGVIESCLYYIMGSKVQSRMSGWSLVSKLIKSQRVVACDDEEKAANEFEKADALLHSLLNHKTSKSDKEMQMVDVQKQLRRMEMNIQEIEEGLECLFKRLIKTRVSLLNILNH